MSHLSVVLKSLALLGLLMLHSQTLSMPLQQSPPLNCVWYKQLLELRTHWSPRPPSNSPQIPDKVNATCKLTVIYSLLRAQDQQNSTNDAIELKDNLKTYIEGLCQEVSHSGRQLEHFLWFLTTKMIFHTFCHRLLRVL